MSTVSVVHEFKTFKLKVTPGTSSTEILQQAAANFKLDFATTGLFHNNTELQLDTPFRLLNLPAGVKLSLKHSTSKKSSIVNIKIQLINSPFEKTSLVKKFDNSKTISQVLKDVENSLNVLILDQNFGLKFQSLTKVISEDDIETTTLAQLGVGNNNVLKISFTTPFIINFNEPEEELLPVSKPNDEIEIQKDIIPESMTQSQVESTIEPIEPPKEIQPQVEDKQDKDDQEDKQDKEDIVMNDAEESEQIPKQHVYVFKPSTQPIESVLPDESIYEVTVDQARQYQNLLSQRAHETPKQKRIRESNKKHVEIKNIEIRIKFPDGSNLQVNFKPNDTNENLYNFVKDSLHKKDEEFQLHIPYPPQILENNSNESLIKNLTSRNLLIFQTSRKFGPFLKSEYLNQAKELNEAPEIQLDLKRHLMKDEIETVDNKIHNGVLPKKKEISLPSSDNNSNNGKKVPKWLKFGKK